MYLVPAERGKGLGKLLIENCLAFAKEAGYAHVYIETLPELRKAMSVYEKFGFRYLDGPMGDSGHFGCDVWMLEGSLENLCLFPGIDGFCLHLIDGTEKIQFSRRHLHALVTLAQLLTLTEDLPPIDAEIRSLRHLLQ